MSTADLANTPHHNTADPDSTNPAGPTPDDISDHIPAGSAPEESAQLGGEVMAVLGALRRLVRRRLRGARSTPPLRGAQLELLQLVESEQGIGVAAAARTLHMAGNSVSTLVHQLVNAGWLHREADPADRRAVCLRLTERAHRRIADWRQARGELLGSALDKLTEADRAALTAALPAMHSLLSTLEESL